MTPRLAEEKCQEMMRALMNNGYESKAHAFEAIQEMFDRIFVQREDAYEVLADYGLEADYLDELLAVIAVMNQKPTKY